MKTMTDEVASNIVDWANDRKKEFEITPLRAFWIFVVISVRGGAMFCCPLVLGELVWAVTVDPRRQAAFLFLSGMLCGAEFIRAYVVAHHMLVQHFGIPGEWRILLLARTDHWLHHEGPNGFNVIKGVRMGPEHERKSSIAWSWILPALVFLVTFLRIWEWSMASPGFIIGAPLWGQLLGWLHHRHHYNVSFPWAKGRIKQMLTWFTILHVFHHGDHRVNPAVDSPDYERLFRQFMGLRRRIELSKGKLGLGPEISVVNTWGDLLDRFSVPYARAVMGLPATEFPQIPILHRILEGRLRIKPDDAVSKARLDKLTAIMQPAAAA